ncbi:helix-turn-helix domain-containing protein [Thalassospira mesophila]|uniref:DNA-binding protein n=1 Tax=Thalassospira mesophila TaxID=1293891 RepID=A0A1Y2KVT0_9PROT|nr:helix-turn-helix domain-containing protein [Thalassospira mesophila]OSQ35993.1 DNA-binding protein [Thalassospira mesophila]
MTAEIEAGDIGQRIKAFRMGKSMTPEELAARIGVSRAAIYRYEGGHPPKLDTLGKIAEGLGVSLPNLLGVGVEYIGSAVSFFERMRQLEENADHISMLFDPVSYLLTTGSFDELLPTVLAESIPDDASDRAAALRDIDTLLKILSQRKKNFRERMPNTVSLVCAAELAQFMRTGFVGTFEPSRADQEFRRDVARREIENIARILRDQPIGTQVGVIVDSMPGATFQLFKQGTQTRVVVSPFRLGTFANIRLGVATVSAAPEAIELYTEMTNRLWRRSLKGEEGADYIEQQILGASL